MCRCVVEQDPDKTWYMSRAFQQTSLSASGLFIADSGLMTAVKFTTEEKIFFKCIISFCFFTDTAPNKCTDVSEIVVRCMKCIITGYILLCFSLNIFYFRLFQSFCYSLVSSLSRNLTMLHCFRLILSTLAFKLELNNFSWTIYAIHMFQQSS